MSVTVLLIKKSLPAAHFRFDPRSSRNNKVWGAMSAKLNRGGSMTASQRKRKEAAEFESGVPVLLNVRRAYIL